MNKLKITKICAIVLASLLAIGMLVPAAVYVFAADEKAQTEQVPLLVIIANFDANGNGQNDFDAGNSGKLFADETSKNYGEQWAKTTVSDWYETFFGNGTGSVADYFSEISCGKFKYIPAMIDKKEEAGVSADGIVSVMINGKHPRSRGTTDSAVNKMYRLRMIDQAVDLASAYVDFSKFDRNGDGKLAPYELRIVVINPGCDETLITEETEIPDDIHFPSVKDLCKSDFEYSNIKITSNGSHNIASTTEYSTPGVQTSVGEIVYQLACLMGGANTGNSGIDETGKSTTVDGWPLAYNLSLLCDGYKLDGGKTPSYLDPYTRIKTGLSTYTTIDSDGEFTLYSTKSGKYDIIRISTPDPDEYFLVELRVREGFDKYSATGSAAGGIMVWHIDEGINSTKYKSGYSCTSVAVDGPRHDPGIVPLVRTGWNQLGNRLDTVSAENPFYYISNDKSTSVFDSSNFCGASSESISLNSYPTGWDSRKGYNLHIEVVSEKNDSVRIKIERSQYVYLPKLTGKCTVIEGNAATVTGNIYREFGETLEGCGVILSKDSNPTEKNGTVINSVADGGKNFFARFENLEVGARYYFRTFAKTTSGTGYSDVGTFVVGATRDYYLCNMYRNITAGEAPIVIKCQAGKPISYDFEMKKEGYRFVGWYTDAALTKAYDMSTVRTDTSTDITLYAKWEKEETTTTSKSTETTVTTVTTSPTGTTTTTSTETTVTTTSTSVKDTTSQEIPQTSTTGTQAPSDDDSSKNTLIIALCIVIVVICAAFITTIGFMRKKNK